MATNGGTAGWLKGNVVAEDILVEKAPIEEAPQKSKKSKKNKKTSKNNASSENFIVDCFEVN